MIGRRWLGLALVGGGAAVLLLAPRWEPGGEERPAVEGAAAVVERFECYRCHDAPGKLVPAERDRHCVRCHQAILAGELDDDRYRPEDVERWKGHLDLLVEVPTLTGIERRFRRDWFVRFLQDPHDLRPNLGATMPRMPISAADAEDIADHFYGEADPTGGAGLGDAERGRALFVRFDCASCHAFSGAGVPAPPGGPTATRAVHLAPDLRHARDQMSPATVLAWLEDPAAMKADTLMPKTGMSEAERRDLAAFVLATPLVPPVFPPIPERRPVLERAVSYAEVEEAVFHKICWHCHSDPVPVGGDGGAGNTGGFGYVGRSIDLGSREAVLRGGREADGSRIDLVGPGASGAPLLVEAMMARYAEEAGRRDPKFLGMPLGLPPMELADIQILETWIAQGCPE